MLTTPQQLAKHFRDVFFGGNWTTVNLQQLLQDVDWQQATNKVDDLNTIATLVFHINYYVSPVMKVLQGGPLVASDKESFNVPPINNEEDWQRLVKKALDEASLFADEIALLPEIMLTTDFADAKYGSYHRNLLGIIEHTHYHLGQISLLKKLTTHAKTAADI